MDIQEIKREARYKAEALMGLFDFIEVKLAESEGALRKEAEKTAFLTAALIDVRRRLREKGQYETADLIRDSLQKTGVQLNDKKDEQDI